VSKPRKKRDPKPKKTSEKKSLTEEGIVKRNFAPDDGPDASVNVVHWEGSLGSDYSIKLHTWSANSNSYFNIRKGRTVGTNIPVQLFWRLISALEGMRQDNPSLICPKPTE